MSGFPPQRTLCMATRVVETCMAEPLAYLNGRYLPESQASLALFDAGFALGATVTEQLRTFGGKLFHVEDHFQRLFRSLEVVGIQPGLSPSDVHEIAKTLVAHNHPLLAAGDDLGLTIFMTPGPYRALAMGRRAGPTVGMHSFPLAFELWAEKYTRGESLVVPHVRQVPSECWPTDLKCRSRMHYYLADREAAERQPGARALLLDMQGWVAETSTANIMVYRGQEGLIAPPKHRALPGISLSVAATLAQSLDIPFAEGDLTPADVAAADEVILTSTPLCLLPVTRFEGKPIGTGQPGPTFFKLMAAWKELVGLDVIAQAIKFARREPPAQSPAAEAIAVP